MAAGAGGARRRDEDDHDDAYTVRPYAVTGGRTRVTGSDLPMEALVQGLAPPDVRLTAERRRILELTARQYQSIAELSAHVRLPVGVVRVLVSELAEAKQVCVHQPQGLGTATSTGSAATSTAATLSVLESVLDGISSL